MNREAEVRKSRTLAAIMIYALADENGRGEDLP
jgi:hypothetical protein